MLPNLIRQSEIRETERLRSKSYPYIHYMNKQNHIIPYIENSMDVASVEVRDASTTMALPKTRVVEASDVTRRVSGEDEPIGLMINGKYVTEAQFHEFYMKNQSIIKEWDKEFLKEPTKHKNTSTKKTESIFGYLYRIFVSDTPNNKTEAIKEKYKETLEHLEVRTPSWPLFVEKEEYNKDVLNQQKIAIEKKLQDDLEQSNVFKWHHLHLRKTTTPVSEKSAENSPPLTPYFTKKSKISP